jgi:hypothetical protein
MTTPAKFWMDMTSEEFLGKPTPPPATEEELRLWESKHGVALPKTLVQAFGVQHGGYVAGTESLVIESVDFILPLDSPRWAHVDDEVDGILVADRKKQFVIGDNGGCAVVLDYNVGDEPRVLSIWHGMGALLRDDDEGTFDEFLLAVPEGYAQEQQDEEEDEEEQDEE